jgi:hypothetical protein
MATLAVQVISHGLSAGTYSGLNPATGLASAAAGGDVFFNDGRTFLRVKNGDSGAHVVTVNSIFNCNQGHDHNIVISVPAGEERWFGPFSPQQFNDANDLVAVTYDGVTSVQVEALRLAEKGR